LYPLRIKNRGRPLGIGKPGTVKAMVELIDIS
jgi:hypothetical protein